MFDQTGTFQRQFVVPSRHSFSGVESTWLGAFVPRRRASSLNYRLLRPQSKQSDQPPPEVVITESESVKVLWGQWHFLEVRDGVLYRHVKENHENPNILQLVVPTFKRTEFIRQCHEGMTGGHRAFRSVLEQVRRRGFWFGWRRDVERFCRQCQACCSYHRGRLPRSGPLQPMVTRTVMERCHVDITGPHPRTPEDLNTY